MWSILLYLVSQVYTQDETERTYKPDWSDLDTRPLPQWYDVAKIGIFIHWGVYSVPAFKSEWFWYLWRFGDAEVLEYINNISYKGSYEDFASKFTAESFDPDAWAQLFAKAGAQYVILTAKHHDGFALFPTKVKHKKNWNSVDVGPMKNLLGLLSESVRKHDMKFGIYYSLWEWFNKMYEEDKEGHFSTTHYTDTVIFPDIKQIVNDYRPSVLWSDGDWDAIGNYWKSTEILAWLYNESPVKDEIVVNDRWGENTRCEHGDFYNCRDRYNPRRLLNHKWESAFTIDMLSWGYRYNMGPTDVLDFDQILETVVSAVSCGGNALINIGPTKEGLIVPIFEERLLQLGRWLHVNGEAIYGTSPWYYQRDSNNRDVWYTCKKKKYNALRPSSAPNEDDVIFAVYAIFFYWPKDNILVLRDLKRHVRENTSVYLLNNEQTILANYTSSKNVMNFQLPEIHASGFAWVLKITEFKEP